MCMEYAERIMLSPQDFDSYGNVLPDRVLTLFQNAANAHACQLGVDFETMAKKNLLWVITQIKYQVIGTIHPQTELNITTWPLAPNRLGCRREYMICDKDGNIMIKGTSNWVLIDMKSRRLATEGEIYPQNNFKEEQVFPGRTPRLRDFEANDKAFVVYPDESTIDANGHVNNTKYADFVLKALQDLHGVMDVFHIEYHHEVFCHQSLNLYQSKSENVTLVKGLDDKGTRMFTCSITLK